MSYTLDRTNNSSTKITVDDGTIDNTSTSLTLVGRAYEGWGEAFNENFLALLENFANTTAPRSPITGQLWYDTANAKLKYFDGTTYNSLTPLPSNSSGYLKNNGSGSLSWEPSISLTQLKATVAASADFAAFKVAIAALS